MKDFPKLEFKSIQAFEKWMGKNHSKSDGIWVKFYKKSSGIKTIVYAEALDVALCYGWIDSQLKSLDDKAYLQKFTPRRSKSVWSKRNIEHIQRLIKARKMKPAGLQQVKAAKADGRWAAAYGSQSEMQIPKDFLKELKKRKKAKEFFKTLKKANLYHISWHLHHAKKPETRERRIQKFIDMLNKGITPSFY